MSASIVCPVCEQVSPHNRICRRCGRPVCTECIGNSPQRCIECQARELEWAVCRRAGCTHLATRFTWRFLDGRACRVIPLCPSHADRVSGSYSLKLIHRGGRP